MKCFTIFLALAGLAFVTGGTSWAQTHSVSEPTWTYQGVMASAAVKMKHVDVVYDPLGLEGVSGNPKFMMWWSPSGSTPNALYAKSSNDGQIWSAESQLTVNYPSTSVPVYHPEVIYDRQGFDEKKSEGNVHFKMWFYDGGYELGTEPGTKHTDSSYSWIRYAESADGSNWQIYEDSPDTETNGKNYVERRSVRCNEISVLYKRDGTGIVVGGAERELVAYHGYLDVSTDGAWFPQGSNDLYGPTDICREMIIAGEGDTVNYRAWDMLPARGNVTSWDSATGLTWNSSETGDPDISGASWTDFYGAMSVVQVGNEYYMYDTMASDNYGVGLLTAPVPEPATLALMALGGAFALIRRRRK